MSSKINPDRDNLVFQIIEWYSDNYERREEDEDIQKENYGSDDEGDSENEFNDDEYEYDSDNEGTSSNNFFKKDNTNYKIYIFGKDNNENTYSVEINEFTPYFYVKVPDYCKDSHRKIFEGWVKDNMWQKYRDCLLRTTLLKKHSFRNFDNFKKYNFIRLVFRNTQSMQNAVKLFMNKDTNKMTKKTIVTAKKLVIPGINNYPIQYDLYENMIDPLLKFIHHKEIRPVGWIKIPKGKYTFRENHSTYCHYDISVRWNDIKYVPDENNVKIKVMSYDIECDSSHGDFPLAIKDYTKLGREIFQRYQKLNMIKNNLLAREEVDERQVGEIVEILENRQEFANRMLSYAFENGNEEEEINRVYTKDRIKPSSKMLSNVSRKIAEYLIISKLENSIEMKRQNTSNINRIIKVLNEYLPELLGDKTIQIGMSFYRYGEEKPYRNYMLTLDTCDILKNAKTLSFKTERELLLKFREIVLKEDPEIITGYNIDGFDTCWLFRRAKELGIDEEFNKLSRFTDFVSEIKEKQVKGPTGELIKKEYVEIPGRIQLDIMPLVQKNYNLESYKLDDVSAEFIKGDVLRIVYQPEENISVIYTKSLKGLNNNNYVMFSEIDGYLENKYNDGEKFEIFDIDKHEVTFKVHGDIRLNMNKKNTWCLGKDDVSPQDIFRLQKGTSGDRYIIAKYCMMDVILCIELLNKLELITNNIGMANVCMNPLSWIIHRGQGVKILSLVAFFIRSRDYLLPYLFKDTFDRDGYEGAVVLIPQPKIYLDDEPISVLDYGSLYPSSMMERNLSHETIVMDPLYLGEDGAKNLENLGLGYEDVSYDVFKTVFNNNGGIKGKVKIGVKSVRYVQYPDEDGEPKRGIIPNILEYLINARKSTRNKISYQTVKTASGNEYIGLYNEGKKTIKTEKGMVDLSGEEVVSAEETYNEFQQKVLDGLQLAFKITANSLYGQIGAKTSDIYYKEIAASTTATGRERLMLAQEYVENEQNYPHRLHNGEIIYLKNRVVYGDSCTGDTPIVLNIDGTINITTFDNFNNSNWVTYNEFKSDIPGLTDKEQIECFDKDMKIWTHNGWAKVNRIIRHHTNKKIYRVLTHNGCVDVTEDHSLLSPNIQQIKPKDCQVGTELLHSMPIFEYNTDNSISEEEAFILGFFVGDGSCGKYENSKFGVKYSWALNNKDIDLLNKCKIYCEKIYNQVFVILDTINSSGVYKLVPKGDIKTITNNYRKMCYNGKSKIIPDIILNSNKIVKEAFLDGLFAADGCRKDKSVIGCNRIDTKNKITAQYYYILLHSLGYNISINDRSDKPNIYRLTWSNKTQRKNPYLIKKIYVLHENYNDYVYDIETEYGVFHAGIGSMIIKNTDSVFVKFQCLDEYGNQLRGREARVKSIALGIETDKAIQRTRLRWPQVLEYEKTFHPFILLSKKRYVGNKYEFDPDKYTQTSMGIVLKRRDNAPIVKVMYGSVIDIIMKEHNIGNAVSYLRKSLRDFINGKFGIETLIISKTLSSYYKDPMRIAHKVLADRIAERDPGNKPQVNDRIPFVYIETPALKNNKKMLQGDKIEHPEYIKKNGLKPDYTHYITNQIMKPVSQIFSLCLDQLPGFKGDMRLYENKYRELIVEGKPINDAIKKVNEIKSKEASKILFGDVLRILENKRSGNNEITSFFRRT